MATLVKFLVNETDKGNPDLFAFFPQRLWAIAESNCFKTAYSHVGQHSGCHVDYAKESRLATSAEYSDLLNELTGIGYKLKVLN